MTTAPVRLVAVATDRSEGGDLAVEWAAGHARAHGAELLAIQVVAPVDSEGAPAASVAELQESLPTDGLTARGAVVTGDDIAATIVEEAHRAGADVVVIGSSGMRGRKEFLLGNVANRVTHLARCTVVVVNTSTAEAAAVEAESISDSRRARAEEIGRVLGPVVLRQLSGRVLRGDGDADGPAACARHWSSSAPPSASSARCSPRAPIWCPRPTSPSWRRCSRTCRR